MSGTLGPTLSLAVVGLCVVLPTASFAAGPYFAIEVVDDATGRGVPLVDLATVNNVHYVTDSNGLVAFDEPGLMNQTVFFTVAGHGYEYPKDGFGYRGKALPVVPGGKAVLKLHRVNIAERLYRITGGGIYRDSVLLGVPVPIRQPLLNGLVLGQDTVFAVEYRGKLHWLWGDTNRPGYPLGNFHTPGATSLLPGQGGLPPGKGVDLTYYVDGHGFAMETAHMIGDGPTWLGGLTALRDGAGRERLLASFVKVRQDMSAHRRGIAQWNDDRELFEEVADLGGTEPPIFLNGHTFQRTVGGVAYVYSCGPYPLTRVRADTAAYRDPSQYEAFTCLKPGATDTSELDRGADGKLRYAWKRNTRALGPTEQGELIKTGKMKEDEALLLLRDADTGKSVLGANGSVYFNPYRGRWVMIASEAFGTSMLGEVWYAEGDTPLGPWVHARKIVTHDRYSFYNPTQHPEFDEAGGRRIYFEGTYTTTFSGNTNPTPRYDYNQIMYRLDLSDPRLALPVPVYRVGGTGETGRLATLRDLPGGLARGPVAFFALDRAVAGTVPAFQSPDGALKLGGGARPAFFALPPDANQPPATTVPLYEFTGAEGRKVYTTDKADPPPGYRLSPTPICRVWRNPGGIALPTE
jgi:hypothetical protein